MDNNPEPLESDAVRTAANNVLAIDQDKSQKPKEYKGCYYDGKTIDPPDFQYVCWFDIMGAASAMKRSHQMAAVFVMKLHVAALESCDRYDVKLFPMIDGIYMVTESEQDLTRLLAAMFYRLGHTFLEEPNMLYRFMVRAAIAYGPVILGSKLTGGSRVLPANEDYCNRIVLGMPLTQAYEGERSASPFGVFVHESARAFSPPNMKALRLTHWRWWLFGGGVHPDRAELAEKLGSELQIYLGWCRDRHAELLYQPERIEHHMMLAKMYVSAGQARVDLESVEH